MRLCYLLIFSVLSSICSADGAGKTPTDLEHTPLNNRNLRNVLHLFQKHQYKLVFSDFLVKRDWVIWQDPAPAEPLTRLSTLLDSFALKLDYDDPSGTIYVVKDDKNSEQIFLQITNHQALACSVQIWATNQLRPYQQNTQQLISVFVPANAPINIHCEGAEDLSIEEPQTGVTYPLDFQFGAGMTEEIVITGTQYLIHSRDSQARKTFNKVELNSTPLRGNDPIQIINSIPGMSTSGVSAKPFIQGGEANELLIQLDGMELIDPFHLKDFYSLYSGINPNTIDNIHFYKGIYPARLGGKMSGAMDITTETKVNEYPYMLGIDAYTSSFQLSGETDNDDLYWNVHGRRGNLKDILDVINPEVGSPRFSDLFAKVHWQQSQYDLFDLGALTLYDNIRLQRDEENYIEKAYSRYENNYGWLRWRHKTASNDQHEVLLSSVNIRNIRQGSLDNSDPFSGSIGVLEDDKNYDLTRIKYDLISNRDKSRTLNFGASLGYSDSSYNYVVSAELGDIAGVLGNSDSLQQNETLFISNLSVGAYLSVLQKINDRIDIDIGLRYDRQDNELYDSDQLSPRLRIALQATSSTNLELGYGRYYQHSAITELSLEDKLALSYAPQKSDHLNLSWLEQVSRNFSYSIGAYYKFIYNPKPRAESLLTQFHFLPELSADRFVINPDFSQLRGLEASMKYQKHSYLAQASYAYSIYKDYYLHSSSYRRWNQKHTINLQLSWMWRNVELSSRLLWHSGWHYSDINLGIASQPFAVEKAYNMQTLPNFLSLDWSATYEQKLKNSVLRWNAQITNTTNQHNIGSYSYSISNTETDENPNLDKTADPLLPVIPSIGLQWLF